MSVRRAQEEINRDEFLSWIAYDRIQPYGPERLDLGFAQICSILAQVHSKKGKRWKPSDFMPFSGDRRKKATSAQEMEHSLILFAKLHNKKAASK